MTVARYLGQLGATALLGGPGAHQYLTPMPCGVGTDDDETEPDSLPSCEVEVIFPNRRRFEDDLPKPDRVNVDLNH